MRVRATILVAGCVLLVIVGVAVYRHSQRSVPAVKPKPSEQLSARSPPKPRLPAPRLSVAPSNDDSKVESARNTNLWSRLINGDFRRVSVEQLDAYLKKHHRSAESLMGAFAASGDRAFLRKALEKNPNDPRLNLFAYYHGDAWVTESSAKGHDLRQPASAERRQLLEAFAKAAPDNALANYLLAVDCLKAGQSDQAVEQFVAASQKAKFQDYSLNYIQDAEEAYRAAGWSAAQAKLAASLQLPLPQLAELKFTSLKIIELAALYRQAGDEASAQAAEQIGLGMGRRLSEAGQLTIIQELVGFGIERNILRTMDPNRVFDNTGQTVQNRLDAISQQQASIKAISVQTGDILPTLSEPDLASYFDRIKVFGETAAAEWLLRTYGKPSAVETSQIH